MAEFVAKTQEVLGAVITTPKLVEKTLSRPPFRFLHDIVTSFIATTGFPEGLYTADQLDHTKVADKEGKLEFLRLLIAAVEAGAGKKCAATPQNIAAGQEAESTNVMLQMLAACATLSPADKAAAVAKAGGRAAAAAEAKPEKKEKPKDSEKDKDREKEKAERAKEREKEREKAERTQEKEREKAERAQEKEKEKERERRRSEKEESGKAAETDDERRERRKREKRDKEKAEEEQRGRKQSADQPPNRGGITFGGAAEQQAATAGRAPPRARRTHEVEHAQSAVDAAPAAGVIVEASRSSRSKKDAADADSEDWMKVAERLEQKPNAPTAGVAGNVEVKGRLAQQALRAKLDQQQTAEEAAAAAASLGPSDGGIVIAKGKGGSRGAHGASGATMNDAELQKLREQLQLLTKASNPLGKFLEATHDDIDSMIRELETWRSEARNQALAAAEARRQTQESLLEAQSKLQAMEDSISDQLQKTNNLRQTILTNDTAIEGMIGMIVGPDAVQ